MESKFKRPFMTGTELRNLLLINDNEELVKLLLDEKIGFIASINDSRFEMEKMNTILLIFCKIFNTIVDNCDLEKLLSEIYDAKCFRQHVKKYLGQIQLDGKVDEEGFQGLYYYLQNLNKVLRYSNNEVRFYLANGFKYFSEARRALRNNNENLVVMEPKAKKMQTPIATEEECQLSDEDFREMSLFPERSDIHRKCEPFLRKNLIDKSYRNIEDYLDTQFRLLREDFIRPIHEAVQDLIRFKTGKNTQASKKKQWRIDSRNVLAYHNVKIHALEPRLTQSGFVYPMTFDMTGLRHIDWYETSRLLPGSVLCLSSDNFASIFVATITDRQHCSVNRKVDEGEIAVKFENMFDFYDLLSSETFTAVESTTYYEAVRHTLNTLKNYELVYDFPLQKYIIDMIMDMEPPLYLSKVNNPVYDLSEFSFPIGQFGKRSRKERYSSNQIKMNIRSVQLNKMEIMLKDTIPWDFMDLDESQFEALHAALTKQFTVIQGPPGTGKTYLGLRIIQAMVRNHSYWTGDKECSPILVLAYKNHALDQFLEGVLQFCPDVIRVGGRSESPKLKYLKLDFLRRKARKNKTAPFEIRKSIKICFDELDSDMKKLSSLGEQMIRSKLIIIGEELTPYISEINPDGSHLKELNGLIKSNEIALKVGMQRWLVPDGDFFYDDIFGPDGNENDLIMIMEKLKINSRGHISGEDTEEEDEDEDLEQFKDHEDDVYEQFDSDGLPKAKMLLAQRQIDSDEFEEINEFEDTKYDQKYGRTREEGQQKKGVKTNVAKFLRKIKRNLNSKDIMSEEEASEIKSILDLEESKRWNLYRLWLSKYRSSLRIDIESNGKNITRNQQRLNDLHRAMDAIVCKNCRVIGMTTTGAGKYRKLVELLAPKIVIVEEAAEILEAHVVASLTSKTQHLILIGDHQQLRPIAGVHELGVNYNMEISLFERMVMNKMACYQLKYQHRMRPTISKLLTPAIYKSLHDHDSVHSFKDIRFTDKNIFFLNHSEYEDRCKSSGHSSSNRHEAQLIVELARYFLVRGYDPSRITILTTYNAQLSLIKREMATYPDLFFKKSEKKFPLEFTIRVSTVDGFQGEECDIILISFVRSNPKEDIGFLKIPNRICVALSRARKGLFCFGNFHIMAKKSSLWKTMTKYLESINAIGDEMTLGCKCKPPVVVKTAHNLKMYTTLHRMVSCNCLR